MESDNGGYGLLVLRLRVYGVKGLVLLDVGSGDLFEVRETLGRMRGRCVLLQERIRI